MKKRLILLSFLFIGVTVSAQHVDLIRENAAFVLDSAHFSVHAEVVYRNLSGSLVNQMMFIPLPVCKEGTKRDTLTVFDVTANRSIKIPRSQPAGLLFGLAFEPNQQKKLLICYTDSHDGKYLTYPLKTQAEFWKGPLAFGSYTLKYDDTVIAIDSMSTPPDTTVQEGGETILTWKRSNYTPAREFEIWFHRK